MSLPHSLQCFPFIAGIGAAVGAIVGRDTQVAGASHERDRISYPVQGFEVGTLSMRAVRWG